MVPKGALIGLGLGIIGAAMVGIYFTNLVNQVPPLVYVNGPSLSILTDKTNFKLGESIKIMIINSGTVPLTFSDSSYGLRVVGLDGRVIFSPVSTQVVSVLEPNEEKKFIWNQTKSDGNKIIDGRYKIVTKTIASGDSVLEKSITINILK